MTGNKEVDRDDNCMPEDNVFAARAEGPSRKYRIRKEFYQAVEQVLSGHIRPNINRSSDFPLLRHLFRLKVISQQKGGLCHVRHPG
jgi:hypothetical protein